MLHHFSYQTHSNEEEAALTITHQVFTGALLHQMKSINLNLISNSSHWPVCGVVVVVQSSVPLTKHQRYIGNILMELPQTDQPTDLSVFGRECLFAFNKKPFYHDVRLQQMPFIIQPSMRPNGVFYFEALLLFNATIWRE